MPDWIGDYEMKYKYLSFGRLVISPRFLLQAVLLMGCYSVTHTHTISIKVAEGLYGLHTRAKHNDFCSDSSFFFFKQMCHQRPVETLPNPVTSFM